METRRLVLTTTLLATGLSLGHASTAQTENQGYTPPPCEYCIYPPDSYGAVTLDFIGVDNDNDYYGRYNGLQERGGYLSLDAIWHRRFDSGHQLDVSGFDLGTQAYGLGVDYGLQGSYSLHMHHRQIPRHDYHDAQTVFITNNDRLPLPGNWVDGGTTTDMDALGSSLQLLGLQTKRRDSALGIGYSALQNWDFYFDYEHTEKSGQRLGAGSFLTTSALMPVPQDFTNESFTFQAEYNAERSSLRIAYYLSFFDNEHESLTWDNPFTTLPGAGEQGRQALEADTSFQQLSGAFSYQFGQTTLLYLKSAIGQGKQDDDYLPLSTNSLLATDSLPRDSLDAEVETQFFQARISSRPLRKLRIELDAQSNDRDNKTAENEYPQVVTDTFQGTTTTNLARDIKRDRYSARASIRLSRDLRMELGAKQKDIERNYSEREESSQETAWLKVRFKPVNFARIKLMYEGGERDGTAIIYDEEIHGRQNPLLRRYHVADRDHDLWRATLSIDPVPQVIIDLSSEIRDETFPDTRIGLTDYTSRLSTLDFNLMPSRSLRFNAFVSYDETESAQAGSEQFGAPDWFSRNYDETWSSGLAVHYEKKGSPWRWQLETTASEFEGRSFMDTAISNSAFPDISAQSYRFSANLYYQLSKRLTLRGAYLFEDYKSDDWQIDGVNPDTISNLLAAGIESPNYDVNVISAGVSWQF